MMFDEGRQRERRIERAVREEAGAALPRLSRHGCEVAGDYHRTVLRHRRAEHLDTVVRIDECAIDGTIRPQPRNRVA